MMRKMLPILAHILKVVMTIIYRRIMMMTRRVSSMIWSMMKMIVKNRRSRMTSLTFQLYLTKFYVLSEKEQIK